MPTKGIANNPVEEDKLIKEFKQTCVESLEKLGRLRCGFILLDDSYTGETTFQAVGAMADVGLVLGHIINNMEDEVASELLRGMAFAMTKKGTY